MAYETSRGTGSGELPIDPDLELAEDARHRPAPGGRTDPTTHSRTDHAARGRTDPTTRGPRPDRPRGWTGRMARAEPRPRSALRLDVLAAIAAGGALGGGARYLVERAAGTPSGRFPWATFSVNVAGAFALAVLLVFVLDIWPPTRYVRPFAAIGFLGAFTTFSTWMVETADLIARHEPAEAAGYLAGSLVAGLAAVSLGLIVGRSFRTRRTRAGASEGG